MKRRRSAVARWFLRRLRVLTALPVAALAVACGGSSTGAPTLDAGVDAPPVSDAGGPLWLPFDPHVASMLQVVWGSGADDVYVGGSSPAILLHSVDRGITWSGVYSAGTGGALTALGGSGPSDVYAIGDGAKSAGAGMILHSVDRGASWQETDLDGVDLRGVWASGPGDVYLVGSSSTGAFLTHSTDRGATWHGVAIAQADHLTGIWGSGANDVYVSGGAPLPSEAGVADAGAAEGGVVLHSSDRGMTWTTVAHATSLLMAIAGTPDGARVEAAGDGWVDVGSSDRGSTWTVFTYPPPSMAPGVQAIWLSPTEINPYFATPMGVVRAIVIDHPDDQLFTWHEYVDPAFQSLSVTSVWGTASDDVYATSGDRRIFHRTRIGDTGIASNR